MKPIFQKLTSAPEGGFAFKTLRAAGFDCPWHVHPEYELILVRQSNGYRIVGDNIAPLTPGDLVLVGPGLPHIWQNEAIDRRRARVHALLIQFDADMLGDGLLKLPAFEPVRRLLLGRAPRGLHFVGATRDRVSALMTELERAPAFARVLLFLRILGDLAASRDGRPLASAGFTAGSEVYDQERMDRVFQFLNAHLDGVVRLSDVARTVSLSDGAFSRFFRLHTGKTFPQFLNELRIGRACRLLIESDKTITEVSYECGFTNLSNFNRQFLRLRQVSPRQYRRQLLQKLPEPAPAAPPHNSRRGAGRAR